MGFHATEAVFPQHAARRYRPRRCASGRRSCCAIVTHISAKTRVSGFRGQAVPETRQTRSQFTFLQRLTTQDPPEPASGVPYYGYRYLSPELGRWINRDPIEEDGGLNVYGFVENAALSNIDPHGDKCLSLGTTCSPIAHRRERRVDTPGWGPWSCAPGPHVGHGTAYCKCTRTRSGQRVTTITRYYRCLQVLLCISACDQELRYREFDRTRTRVIRRDIPQFQIRFGGFQHNLPPWLELSDEEWIEGCNRITDIWNEIDG